MVSDNVKPLIKSKYQSIETQYADNLNQRISKLKSKVMKNQKSRRQIKTISETV